MNDAPTTRLRMLASYIASGVMGEFSHGVEAFLKSLGANEYNASAFNVRTYQTDPTVEHVYRENQHVGTIQAYISADALSLSVRCFPADPPSSAAATPLPELLSGAQS